MFIPLTSMVGDLNALRERFGHLLPVSPKSRYVLTGERETQPKPILDLEKRTSLQGMIEPVKMHATIASIHIPKHGILRTVDTNLATFESGDYDGQPIYLPRNSHHDVARSDSVAFQARKDEYTLASCIHVSDLTLLSHLPCITRLYGWLTRDADHLFMAGVGFSKESSEIPILEGLAALHPIQDRMDFEPCTGEEKNSGHHIYLEGLCATFLMHATSTTHQKEYSQSGYGILSQLNFKHFEQEDNLVLTKII